MEIHIFTDGGARWNPGKAGCGFVLYDSAGEIIYEGYKSLGISTNNQAEYWGAILWLEQAVERTPSSIVLHMDSELVVKQLRGEYKIKNLDMKMLFQKVQQVVSDYPGQLEIKHVPREQNKYADMLSNKAMDMIG